MVRNAVLIALLVTTFDIVSFAQLRVPFRDADIHPLEREVLEIQGTTPADKNELIAQLEPVKPITCNLRSNITFDGQCNHIGKNRLGSANTGFQSLFDKLNPHEVPREIDLPSPRLVSNLVAHESFSPPNKRNMSEIMTFFGQFVDHIIAETHASKVPADIPIPADDSSLPPGGAISFNRSVRVALPNNGSSPQNIISAFLDASAIYGVKPKTVAAIRLYKDGLLKTSSGNLMPLNNNMHFIGGDVRANENPALQAMHTLWMREHNRVAAEVKAAYHNLSDELIFDKARRIVIAELQHVVFYEFVPTMLGRQLPKYEGYREHLDASISNEFATVAYRCGHSLVNPTLTVYYDDGKPVKKDLSEVFFQTSFVREYGIDGIFRGLLSSRCAEVDVGVTSQLRNLLFPDLTNGGADLVALNIQRGRDHGIAPYNKLRQFYGLSKKNSFNDICSDVKVAKALHDVYLGDIDAVDAFIGGLAEDHYRDSSLGELFYMAWLSEFTRMRDGNRFYFENQEYKSFMPDDIIDKIPTLANIFQATKKDGAGIMQRVIRLNTKLSSEEVDLNPFRIN